MDFNTIEIDKQMLMANESGCRELGVPYKFGQKALLRMDAIPAEMKKGIDCSGYVQWLVHEASGKLMPSGSVLQRTWCRRMGFKSYGKLGYLANCLLKDHRLRIAFFAGNPGHVWLVLDGQTIESYGGHGPGRRSAIAAPLMKVQECFVLTEPL